MKKLLIYTLVGALILALLWSLDSCRDLKGKAARWETQYNAAVKARDQAIVASVARIGELETKITELQGDVASSVVTIAAKDKAIAVRDERIAVLEADEPVAPELESHPLVINLRAQITEWKLKFSLTQDQMVEKDRIIAKQDEIITTLGVPVLVGIKDGKKIFSYPEGSVTWELNQTADREHALRLNCEKGLSLYKRQANAGRFWRAVAIIEPIVFTGLAIFTK